MSSLEKSRVVGDPWRVSFDRPQSPHFEDPARFVLTERELRFVPTPYPTGEAFFASIYSAVIAFILGFGLWRGWLPSETLVWLFTCGLTAHAVLSFVLTRWSYASELRQGDWLVLDRSTGGVTLPRLGLSFARHELVELRYLWTHDPRWRWGELRDIHEGAFGELHLVIRVEPPQVWHILSGCTQTALNDLVDAWQFACDIPVICNDSRYDEPPRIRPYERSFAPPP